MVGGPLGAAVLYGGAEPGRPTARPHNTQRNPGTQKGVFARYSRQRSP